VEDGSGNRFRFLGTSDWDGSYACFFSRIVVTSHAVDAGKGVVKTGTLGFNEPWLVLATWNMLKKPAIQGLFTSSLFKPAVGTGRNPIEENCGRAAQAPHC
jgi:hypothetical protein